jgi:predicted DNA-binding transcriptional regulator AlpA
LGHERLCSWTIIKGGKMHPESPAKIQNPESPAELAKRWNVATSWVYNQTRQTGPDAIPRIKMGKYVRFISAEVDAWALSRSARVQPK